MADILDSLDDLDDAPDEGELENSEEVQLEDFPDDGASLDTYDMSEDEAKEITDAIRSSATATYILLSQAHERKAWKALGYDTWSEYVKKEFEISPQRSYQLLDLSKTINEIEAVAPEGTAVKLTEAQARDIKRELPHITEQIKEQTDGQEPEQASKTIDHIVDDIREQKKLDDEALKKKKAAEDQARKEGYQNGLEAAADAMLEDDKKKKNQNSTDPDRPDGSSDSADGEFVEVDVDGDGSSLSAQQSMDLYNFFNVLASLTSLPEPDDFVKEIPEDRSVEVENQLLAGTSWLNRFQTLWELRKES